MTRTPYTIRYSNYKIKFFNITATDINLNYIYIFSFTNNIFEYTKKLLYVYSFTCYTESA